MAQGARDLVVVERRPFNAETPMEALAEALTETRLFYVRNHFEVPELDRERWRLAVGGLVETPIEVSLDDLQRLGERTVTLTLECAGNGRKRIVPTPPGTPWGYGAVSTARFTGAPLHRLLDRVRPRAEAVEIVFTGADEGEVAPGRRVPFARSLPIEAARDPDTLLAWGMNGEPLAADHGFPVRLVVPRWYGIASVKWLVAATLSAKPFEGYFQKERYVYEGEAGTPEKTPVTSMRVRSVIAEPPDGARLRSGLVEVRGTAWSGAARVRAVQVSVDGGLSWAEAELRPPASPYAATAWRFPWRPAAAGAYTILARATDEAGYRQPLEARWNAHGYGNNVVHGVQVTVAGES